MQTFMECVYLFLLTLFSDVMKERMKLVKRERRKRRDSDLYKGKALLLLLLLIDICF